MSYTVVDDDDVIQVRASLKSKAEPDELKALILALIRRHPDLTGMSKLIIELEKERLV